MTHPQSFYFFLNYFFSKLFLFQIFPAFWQKWPPYHQGLCPKFTNRYTPDISYLVSRSQKDPYNRDIIKYLKTEEQLVDTIWKFYVLQFDVFQFNTPPLIFIGNPPIDDQK